jgi:hypothetical protein
VAINVPIVSQWNPKGVNSATKSLGGLEGVAKKLGTTFAGVFATQKLASFFASSVKGALDDQRAQVQLANSIRNTTFATNLQIRELEQFILKTQFATGVTDEQLRPALNRLVLVTGDTTKSQKLLSLAMDVSAGTGKDLESVTAALAKAAGGQTTALSRLGVGLDKTILKSGDLDVITAALTSKFEGQAAAAAGTLAGKMKILTGRFEEAKEEIGYGLITAFDLLSDPNGAADQFGVAISDAGTNIGNFTVGVADLVLQMKTLTEEFIATAKASGYLPKDFNMSWIYSLIPVIPGVVAGFREITQRGKEVTDELKSNQLAADLSADRYTLLAKSLGYVFPKQEKFGDIVEKTTKKVAELSDEIKALINANIKLQESVVNNLQSSLSSAESSLDSVKNKFQDFKDTISGSVTGIIDFSSALESGDFLKALLNQAQNATTFADKVKQLINMGLSENAIRHVLDAGYEAGSLIADQIIAGGTEVVNQVNTLLAAVESVAVSVGELGAATFYQQGVNQGEALVAGIRAALEAARAELDRLRASLTAPVTATGNGSAKIPQSGLSTDSSFSRRSGTGYGMNDFSRLASGGIAMGPTFALIGEAGPEAVVPLNKAKGFGGATYNIVVNAGLGANGNQIGRDIVEAITRYERNSGQVFARA